MKQNNHQKQIRIYGISAVLFATITVVVYLLMPLFSLPVSELECGYDWIVYMWQTGIVANITSFLLPIIGLVGMVATVFARSRGPHMLSVAFAMLPALFYIYMITLVKADFSHAFIGDAPAFDPIGSGAWIALATSCFALIFTVLIAYKEWRLQKSLQK